MEGSDNLIVLTFEGMATAAAAYEQIEKMAGEGLLEVADAIILERDADMPGSMVPMATETGQGSVRPVTGPTENNIRVVQTHGKKGKYAAAGAGIGFLAGFLLGGPIGGLVVGASLGAITAAMKDFGIDDANIAAIKARLQPNTSALLLLGRANDREAVLAQLRTFDPQVTLTTLAPEVEKELRARLES